MIVRKFICEDEVNMRMIFAFVPVAVWAIRLSSHIGCRKRGEDYRYKEMREGWE